MGSLQELLSLMLDCLPTLLLFFFLLSETSLLELLHLLHGESCGDLEVDVFVVLGEFGADLLSIENRRSDDPNAKESNH